MIDRRDAGQRVVVTGMGIVSPVGLNVEQSWQTIISGESGITSITDPAKRDSRIHVAGQINGFEPTNYFPAKELRRVHRSAQFSLAASIEALTDSGLFDGKLRDVNPEDIGVRMGTGVGGAPSIADVQDTIRDFDDTKISPYAMLQLLAERTATVPSMKLNLQGPVSATIAACASGNIAVTDAIKEIRNGDAVVMVAGGTEASNGKIGMGGFAAIKALSTSNGDPETASRPFDKGANGFVMSEGSAVIVLERLDHAQARGAYIRAEVVGFGNTSDAHHDTAPSGLGAERAMRKALATAQLGIHEIDYINAHGTSTPTGDGVELDAIMRVFNSASDKLAISSSKSMTGHMLGATGAFELIMCIKAIEAGIIPPTINLREPIREGFNLVPLVAQKRRVDAALNNSFGFGGINSTVAVVRFNG